MQAENDEISAEPAKVLRGFERVYLAAGESSTITLSLAQRDISYWNVVNQKWTVASGKYTVSISTSAGNADIKLQDSFNPFNTMWPTDGPRYTVMKSNRVERVNV